MNLNDSIVLYAQAWRASIRLPIGRMDWTARRDGMHRVTLATLSDRLAFDRRTLAATMSFRTLIPTKDTVCKKHSHADLLIYTM